MPVIHIEPQNPLDLRHEDLADFQSDLQQALPDLDVQLLTGTEMPRGARGVTWWEVVHVYLPDLANDARAAIVAIILERAYQWAKRRFRRKWETTGHRDHRPKCVILHEASGAEITSVELQSGRHKPVTKEDAVTGSGRQKHRKKNRTKKSVKKKKKSSRQQKGKKK